jgi:NAD-dependent dihydropyrimidine dehydrogenase PreA subunit
VMVGLPTETADDIRALAGVAARARRALGRGVLTLSAAPFVPKPQTPLQWEPMAPETVLRERIRLLERACGREKGLRVVAEAPKWARVQGLLSRGGRSVAPLLETAARSGDWRTALRNPLASQVLDRERDPGAPLPWDFITGGPDRRHLVREQTASRSGEEPTPCRPGSCRTCGICDPACSGEIRISKAETRNKFE